MGTHYGGSLYSMADPFYMLMPIENLGRDYIVWDKSANIRFRKPATGVVSAAFRLSDAQIEEIREALKTEEKEEKIDRVFALEIKDESGAVVAEVQKQLHIRRKSPGSHQERLASGTRSPSRGASSTPARST